MDEKEATEEDLRKQVQFHIDVARDDLEVLRRAVETCDIVDAFSAFRDLYANTERARRHSSELASTSKIGMYKDISLIEGETFDIIGSIPLKCGCVAKGV